MCLNPSIRDANRSRFVNGLRVWKDLIVPLCDRLLDAALRRKATLKRAKKPIGSSENWSNLRGIRDVRISDLELRLTVKQEPGVSGFPTICYLHTTYLYAVVHAQLTNNTYYVGS